MPRAFQYTTRRYWLMQAAMFGVLFVSLGVAALVDRTRPTGIVLDEIVSLGDVNVGLPGGWEISLNQKLGQVRAAENASRNAARRVVIVQRRMQSLLDRFVAPPSQRVIPFGQLGTGSLNTSPLKQGNIEAPKRTQAFATCDLKDGTMLTISMDAPAGADGAMSATDLDLIKQIAASANRKAEEE